MEYTESIYVDAKNGDDDNGSGTVTSPFLTLQKALNNVKTTDPIIYLDKGIYPISILQDLSLTGKKLTVKGKDLDTVIEVGKTTMTVYLGQVHIFNLVITPSDSFSGDTRVISYSNDNYKVSFNNVLFKNNNTFPTATWFYTRTSGTSYDNKDFYNCTFTGNLAVCKSGSVNIFNCALQYSDFGNVNVNENSILNGEYDSTYNLINYDNSLYGVYSGEHAWESLIFLLKQNNQYYTIKTEHYSNGQFQPLTLEGGEQPNENDYENFGFKDVNDLLIPQNTKTIQGIDKGELGEGKYFEVELDNEIKKINNIEKISSISVIDDFSTKNNIFNVDGGWVTIDTSTGTLDARAVGMYSPGKATFVHVCKKIRFEYKVTSRPQYVVFKIDEEEVSISKVPGWNVFEEEFDQFEKHSFEFYFQANGSNGQGSILLNYIEMHVLGNNVLIEQNNQYYTFNNSDIALSPSQELTEDNFKNNGFDNPSNITEEQWNNSFPDKTDLKLLMWTDDLEEAEIKAECEIEPFTSYDKLNDEFEICMATDKE